MVGTALLYCLLGIHLSVAAQPEENKPQNSEGAASFISGGKPVREEALLQVVEFVKRENTQLKERLQESYTDLKELLKEGDANLKERVLEGDEQLKEQLKEGDSRLKEELDGDVAWLKGKMEKLEARMTEDLAEQREAFEKRKESDKALCQASIELIADLKQQVSEVQAELNSTRQGLQSELETSRETVQLLQATVDQLTRTAEDQDLSDNGSTFTRWGKSSCPDNTSLVYSGLVGGAHYEHKGGASIFLCLVRDPQLDNTTAVPSRLNYVYGVEYEDVEGHHEQDVVCSVCRAPHSTTIMVPATRTCPAGWTYQYKGHLMSGQHSNDVNAEYVCVDQDREHREGGQGERDGGNLFHVVTRCGSLPCPPYVNNLLVTCVVCSL